MQITLSAKEPKTFFLHWGHSGAALARQKEKKFIDLSQQFDYRLLQYNIMTRKKAKDVPFLSNLK